MLLVSINLGSCRRRARNERGSIITSPMTTATLDPVHSPPPLQVILSYAVPAIRHVGVTIWSMVKLLSRILVVSTATTTRPVVALMHVLLAPLLFLLSPLVFTARLFTDILVIRPYVLLSHVGDQLYDAWVFVGVAVLLGAVVGLSIRFFARTIIRLTLRAYSKAPEPRSVRSHDLDSDHSLKTSVAKKETKDGSRDAERARRCEWRRVR
jgi:hypothetical protein